MANMTNDEIANSNILVTGGAGFVGSYLVEELLEYKPKKIYIIDNLIRGNSENMKGFASDSRVKFIQGDIRDEKLIDDFMSKIDFCFHLAALRINACAADPIEGYDVMVKGTFGIVEAARRHKIKKLIYSSSASVYGLAQHFPTPETDNPYDNQTFYGGAKLFGEQLLRSYYYMYGLDYVALRYFNVYGPRMDTDGKYTEVMIKWLDCIKENRPPLIFGDGSTTMDFVYVEDVAKANILALLSDTTDKVFNIGDQKETSLKQLLELILKVNKSPLKPKYRADSGINPVSRRLANIAKARQLLGYIPAVSLENGLKELSNWYFGRKDIKK